MKKSDVFGSVISAFILGAGGSMGVGMLFSGGKFNAPGLTGVVVMGLMTAAKDYRSLKKMPPIEPSKNGDTSPPFKPTNP